LDPEKANARYGSVPCLLWLNWAGIVVDKAGGLVSLISLLFASIQQDALTLIDDFAILNKNRVLLRSVLGMDLKTGDPGWTLQMACSPHSGNFKRAQRSGVRKNCRNIFCDDLTVIWLGQVACRIGIGHIFGNVHRCTAAEKDGQNEDGETHLPLPEMCTRSVHSTLPAI